MAHDISLIRVWRQTRCSNGPSSSGVTVVHWPIANHHMEYYPGVFLYGDLRKQDRKLTRRLSISTTDVRIIRFSKLLLLFRVPMGKSVKSSDVIEKFPENQSSRRIPTANNNQDTNPSGSSDVRVNSNTTLYSKSMFLFSISIESTLFRPKIKTPTLSRIPFILYRQNTQVYGV